MLAAKTKKAEAIKLAIKFFGESVGIYFVNWFVWLDFVSVRIVIFFFSSSHLSLPPPLPNANFQTRLWKRAIIHSQTATESEKERCEKDLSIMSMPPKKKQPQQQQQQRQAPKTYGFFLNSRGKKFRPSEQPPQESWPPPSFSGTYDDSHDYDDAQKLWPTFSESYRADDPASGHSRYDSHRHLSHPQEELAKRKRE